MKFKLEDIKRFVFGALKKYIWEGFLRGASKGLATIVYQIPVVNAIAFIKDFLSTLGLGKSIEDRIYESLNDFLLKAVMGQQVVKFAWGL